MDLDSLRWNIRVLGLQLPPEKVGLGLGRLNHLRKQLELYWYSVITVPSTRLLDHLPVTPCILLLWYNWSYEVLESVEMI